MLCHFPDFEDNFFSGNKVKQDIMMLNPTRQNIILTCLNIYRNCTVYEFYDSHYHTKWYCT